MVWNNSNYIKRLSNLESSEYYEYIESGTLKDLFISAFNTKINLFNFKDSSKITELHKAGIAGRCEAFKIINNDYGMRWLILTESYDVYSACAWNVGSKVVITKLS